MKLSSSNETIEIINLDRSEIEFIEKTNAILTKERKSLSPFYGSVLNAFTNNISLEKKYDIYLDELFDQLIIDEQDNFSCNNSFSKYFYLNAYLDSVLYAAQQQKIIQFENEGVFITFNTGLLNKELKQIHCLLKQNKSGKPTLLGFSSHEKNNVLAKILIRKFPQQLPKAIFFSSPSQLFYDFTLGKPTLDSKSAQHILLERYFRSMQFIGENMTNHLKLNYSNLCPQRKLQYKQAIYEYLSSEKKIFNQLKDKLEESIEYSYSKILEFDYRIAHPIYQFNSNINEEVAFLLPMYLNGWSKVDSALVVNKRDKKYYCSTILSLEQTARCSILLNRPFPSWLRGK